MKHMFYGATSFERCVRVAGRAGHGHALDVQRCDELLGDLSAWQVGQVTNMESVQRCNGFSSDLSA